MHEQHLYGEMHPSCRERIAAIDKRLSDGDKILSLHTTDIAVLKTNMTCLIKSINGLTRSLWGICGTITAALFGFFVWYVQNI